MRKSLPAFLFLFLFSLFFSVPQAFASAWVVRSEHPPFGSPTSTILFSNTPTATFIIHSDTETLKDAPVQYRFYAYKAGDGKSPSTEISGIFKTGDGHTVTIPNVPIRDAVAPPIINAVGIPIGGSPKGQGVVGDWRIELCKLRLTGGVLKTCERTLVKQNVRVQPPGTAELGLPAMCTKGKVFEYGTSVKVTLKNIAIKTPYTFWWYSPRNYNSAVIAENYKFTEGELTTDHSKEIDVRTTSSGVYDLCMTPNDPPWRSRFTFGLNCDFHITGTFITPKSDEATSASKDEVCSGPAGIPQENSDSSGITCDQYVDPSTGSIIPTTDPRILDPSFPKKCAPGALGPCAEYVYPKMTIYPANTWGQPIPTNQVNNVAYKECKKINTAIGNIAINPGDFIKSLFGILLGISGGIAMLLIIVSGYSLITSQGEPQKVQGARETLTSAVVGLVFIILSLVILEVIGVDLLQIPGFGR